MTKPIAVDVYDQIAEAYSTKTETSPFNALYERPAMMRLMGDVTGKHVFDAGCGHGYYAEQVLARGAARVVGIDASPKMVNLAQARLGSRARMYVADVAGPLAELGADSSFDLVICPLVLHYIADWNAPLLSFSRLLRDGGAAVISVGHPMEEFKSSVTGNYFERELLQQAWPSFGVTMPTFRRSLSEMFGAIKGAGFVVEELVEPLPQPELEPLNPELYRTLCAAPNFLCLRLRTTTPSP
jgi:ubiquinone/menaquinone biosynthesis C-methylase UbiE